MSEQQIDLSFLREREEKILCALCGIQSQNSFGDGLRKSRKTIAADLGITVEQVGEIKKRAMGKVLKQNAKLYQVLEKIEEVEADEADLMEEEDDILTGLLGVIVMNYPIEEICKALGFAFAEEADSCVEAEERQKYTAIASSLLVLSGSVFVPPSPSEAVEIPVEEVKAESEGA